MPTSDTKNEVGSRASVPLLPKAKISFLQATYGAPPMEWQDIGAEIPAGAEKEVQSKARQEGEATRKQLREYLHSVLTTPNLVVLAGSGASLGKVGGPSMRQLWEKASELPKFKEILTVVKQPHKDEWIENLLSRCKTAKQFLDDSVAAKVKCFLDASEEMIWETCSGFIEAADLEAHKTFLRRMARRRLRAPRLKLFTTNYDLCFETAGGELGITMIDGFSFSQPQRFDPRFFNYDVVRRAKHTDDSHDFVEGVIQILKLHGSVDWHYTPKGIIQMMEKPTNPCLIYPVSTKYELSYSQPHLELMSQFQSVLREPNTCLVTIGFGFSDNHLSASIMAAVESNPSLKLLAVDSAAESKSEDITSIYSKLRQKIAIGEADIELLNAEFAQFAELIPQLRALSPAEQIEHSVSQIARESWPC